MKRNTIILLSLFLISACAKKNDVVVPEPDKTYEYSTFTDTRDNNTYKTIVVGDQEWMIENLKYRLKFGSLDGCLSYGEKDFDTTKVVINKENFKEKVLQTYPELGNFGSTFFWVWYSIDDQFVSSRGRYYRQGWNKYKSEMISPYYDGIEMYAPFIQTLDSIAHNLYAPALIEGLKNNYNVENVQRYGYLYKFSALPEIAPEGWRIPTDEDFKILEKNLGLQETKLDIMEDWRDIKSIFLHDLYEHNKFAGTKIYGTSNQRDAYRNINFQSYYWTSTEVPTGGEYNYNIIRSFQAGKNSIFRGTHTVLEVANSVICVRDL